MKKTILILLLILLSFSIFAEIITQEFYSIPNKDGQLFHHYLSGNIMPRITAADARIGDEYDSFAGTRACSRAFLSYPIPANCDSLLAEGYALTHAEMRVFIGSSTGNNLVPHTYPIYDGNEPGVSEFTTYIERVALGDSLVIEDWDTPALSSPYVWLTEETFVDTVCLIDSVYYTYFDATQEVLNTIEEDREVLSLRIRLYPDADYDEFTDAMEINTGDLFNIILEYQDWSLIGRVPKITYTFDNNPQSNEELTQPDISLYNQYPNPFNQQINFKSKENGKLQIFNIKGQLVKTLTITPNVEIKWDGKDEKGSPIPVGVYLSRLTTESIITKPRKFLFWK